MDEMNDDVMPTEDEEMEDGVVDADLLDEETPAEDEGVM
jgi:hypothetical protein